MGMYSVIYCTGYAIHV